MKNQTPKGVENICQTNINLFCHIPGYFKKWKLVKPFVICLQDSIQSCSYLIKFPWISLFIRSRKLWDPCHCIFHISFQPIIDKPVVMSSSWNFPDRASPSCEGLELSQAELRHFNFRAETELKSSWQYWQYVYQKLRFCASNMISWSILWIYIWE